MIKEAYFPNPRFLNLLKIVSNKSRYGIYIPDFLNLPVKNVNQLPKSPQVLKNRDYTVK